MSDILLNNATFLYPIAIINMIFHNLSYDFLFKQA